MTCEINLLAFLSGRHAQSVKAMRSAKRATIQNAELLWNLEAQVEPLDLLSNTSGGTGSTPPRSGTLKRKLSLLPFFKRRGSKEPLSDPALNTSQSVSASSSSSTSPTTPRHLDRSSSAENGLKIKRKISGAVSRRSSVPDSAPEPALAPAKNTGSGFAAALPPMLHKPPNEISAIPKFLPAQIAPGMVVGQWL